MHFPSTAWDRNVLQNAIELKDFPAVALQLQQYVRDAFSAALFLPSWPSLGGFVSSVMEQGGGIKTGCGQTTSTWTSCSPANSQKALEYIEAGMDHRGCRKACLGL